MAAVQAEAIIRNSWKWPSSLIYLGMAIIRNSWVQQPRIVMVLQTLTSRLPSCNQLIVGSAHVRGGTLDVPVTDVLVLFG